MCERHSVWLREDFWEILDPSLSSLLSHRLPVAQSPSRPPSAVTLSGVPKVQQGPAQPFSWFQKTSNVLIAFTERGGQIRARVALPASGRGEDAPQA